MGQAMHKAVQRQGTDVGPDHLVVVNKQVRLHRPCLLYTSPDPAVKRGVRFVFFYFITDFLSFLPKPPLYPARCIWEEYS